MKAERDILPVKVLMLPPKTHTEDLGKGLETYWFKAFKYILIIN